MEEHDIYVMVASLAAGGCVFSIVWLTVNVISAARAQALKPSFRKVKTSSPMLRLMRPVAQWAGYLVGAVAARIETRLGRDSSRSFLLSTRIRIAKGLRAAGQPENLTPDEFIGLVVVSAIIGLGFGFLIFLRVKLGFVPIITMVIGGLMPVKSLRAHIQKRQREMRHLLPYTLDLLTLSIEAGLDFTEALHRIVRRLTNTALGDELGEALRQIQLGMTRSQALRDLADRIALSELRSVVSALIQTDELGGNLGPTLRAQAQQLRETRSQVAEKAAMEAPVKILFPLVLFIFPTIFIMIFGPIVLKIMLEK